MPAREAAAAAAPPHRWAEALLRTAEADGLLRRRRTRAGGSDPRGGIAGRRVVVLSSNDYLGLSVHPEVRAAASRAALELGVGATGSAHLSGFHAAAEQLEDSLARFEGSPTATLAPSGYAANLAALQALGGRDAVILSDRLNHASIIDGCRASGSRLEVYRHRDLDDLETRLRRGQGRPIIVSDTVFSMDGTGADVPGLNALAERYGAWLVLDEAHATGTVGPEGRGAAEAAGLDGGAEHVVRVVTLSKALGAGGGAVCGSRAVAQLLLQRGRALMFSTALPHPTVAAAHAALGVLRRHPELVGELRHRAAVLRDELGSLALPAAGDAPIVAIMVGGPERAIAAERTLWEAGFLVQAVRPPTVPAGTSRLRLVASVLHSEADLREAAAATRAALAP